MSRHRCCVDGCFTKQDGELSFFRCPKNERSSNAWKQALGFTGKHRFANLSPDQCNKRIKICSLHFDENSFTNPEGNRIHRFAVPSLNIETIDDINAILNDGPNPSKIDVFVQTEANAPIKLKETGKIELELGTLNLTQICRICKCVAPQMRSLFEGYENAHQSPRIDEMLMACASVQVLYGDGLPAQICQICVEQLGNAFVFKHQVERMDVSLRQYVKNVKIEIKHELQNSDFIEPLNTLTNFLNKQAKDSNQEPSDSSVIQKTETDYIQFLDNDQMLLTCRECSKIFTTLNGLRCHKRLHTGNLYKCSKCDKRYTRLDHLQRHEKSHIQKNAALSNYADVDDCFEQVEVTKNIEEPKIKQMVEEVNYVNETFLVGDKETNYDSGMEKLKECLKNELEMRVEDSLIMEDNREDGYNSVSNKRYVTESIDWDKIMKMDETGLNDKENNLSETSTADNSDNNDNRSSMEKETECIENETDDLKEVTVEDNLDMEDNFLDDEDNTVNIEHYARQNSEDSTDSEYLPKRTFLPNIKYEQGKNLQRPKIKNEAKEEEEYGEFPCPACQEMFTTMSELDKHARGKHEGLKIYKCDLCIKEFSRADHLKRHSISHSAFKAHRCNKCTSSFKTRETLNRHQKLHERSSQIKCDICETTFSRIDLLANHKASKHGIGEKVMVRKKYECPLCHISFATENYRDIHVSRHTRQLNNECAKNLVCSECGRRFLRKDYLIAHMRRHRREMFKCKYCGKGFPRLLNLTVHERYHTEERSHLCTICGKGFGRAYNLTVHMKTHTREKPHQCTQCDAAFVQSNDLSIHMRRHTGERFQCELCSKSFLMKYQLTQHKRTVHGLSVVIDKQKDPDEPAPITLPLPKPLVLDNIIFNTMHAQLTAQSHLTKEERNETGFENSK